MKSILDSYPKPLPQYVLPKIDQKSEEIRKQPDNPFLYIERAELYSEIGNGTAVVDDVRSAMSMQSEDFGIIERGARVLYYADQFPELLRLAAQFIADKQRNWFGYQVRSLYRFGTKDYRGTIEDIIKAGEFPDDRRLFWDYQNDEILRPKSMRSVALDNLHDDPNVQRFYDFFFAKLKEQSDGPMTTGTSMYILQSRISLLVNYVKYYEAKKSPSEVAALLEKIKRVNGLYTRTRVFMELGRLESALKDAAALVNSSEPSQRSNALTLRARVYQKAGNLTLALNDLVEAGRLEEDCSSCKSNIKDMERRILKQVH